MVGYWIQVSALCLILTGAAFSDDRSAREQLFGNWREAGDSHAESIWLIQNKGDTIQITRSVGGQKISQLECNIMGRDCEISDSGKRVKLSFYFNGSRLVELESRDSAVTKRRFNALEEGNTLEIEVIQLVPAGKTETIRLYRVSTGSQ